MSTTSITNVADLVKIAQDIVHTTYLRTVWWRGVARDWEEGQLVPAVYRKSAKHTYERRLLTYFMAKARPRYPNCPPEDDTVGWLFLMQRYGLPTRLLEWTESPLIAAFFAVAEEPEHDSTLWALKPFALNYAQAQYMGILNPHSDNYKLRILFQKAFIDDGEPSREMVLAVTPREIDNRMLVQCSAFTIHDDAAPLEKAKFARDLLLRFTIPKTAKAAIQDELHSIGIRLDNLFPDLEHLAMYLSDFSPLQSRGFASRFFQAEVDAESFRKKE